MIKCCIFDLDGTLLNTLTTITYYVNLTTAKRGIAPITEEECKRFIGNGALNLIRRTLESKGITDEDLSRELWQEYMKEYNVDSMYLTVPYGGIPELLSALKEKGVLLGVLSNKQDSSTRDVVEKIFPGVFDAVRGDCSDSIPLKPAPDGLFLMMDKLIVKPEEVLYIGDTGVDMKTGKAAAVKKTVGVLWGFRSREELIESGADILVENPLDILSEVSFID